MQQISPWDITILLVWPKTWKDSASPHAQDETQCPAQILKKSACMSARWSWKALWWKGPWPVLSQHIPNPGMWEDSGHKSLGENCRLSKKGQAVTNELIIDLVSFSHLWITQWCTCCLQRVVQMVLTKICASWLCWFLCLERKRAVGIIKQHHHKHHSML